jgi:hypothetical protein
LIAVFWTGCEKKPTGPAAEVAPRLFFEPGSVRIAVTQATRLSLIMDGVAEPVYGISLQLTHNDSVASFSDSLGVQIGGYFGPNALLFVRSNDSTIHLSITNIQRQADGRESNTLCILTFTGSAVGSSIIRAPSEQLCLYDSEGEVIDVPALETDIATIEVD